MDLTCDADTPGRMPASVGATLQAAASTPDAACAGTAVPAPHSPAASSLLELSPDASPAAQLLAYLQVPARLQHRAPDAGPTQSAPVVARPQNGTAASAPAPGGVLTASEAGPPMAQAGQAVAGDTRVAGSASGGAPGPVAGWAGRALAGSKRGRPALQPLYASDDEQPNCQAPARPCAVGRSGATAGPSSAGALAAVAGCTSPMCHFLPRSCRLAHSGCALPLRCRQESNQAGSDRKAR